MYKVLWYPAPAIRAKQWRGLFRNADLAALSSGHLLPLPWPAEVDWEAAKIWGRDEQALALSVGAQLTADSLTSQMRHYARRHHWCRLLIARARNRGATHLAIWGGIGRRRVLVDAAAAAGLRLLIGELAPFPGKMTLDPKGANIRSSLPADPAYFANWALQNPGRLPLELLVKDLVARVGVKRASTGRVERTRPYLFVPLQVRNDAQVRRYGRWLFSVPEFIDAIVSASRALPADWQVIFREHPSCKVGNAEQLKALASDRIIIDNETDTFDLARGSQGVVTLNSSVGLQSFLLDRPVLVLGEANYALPGLALNARSAAELQSLFDSVKQWSFDSESRHNFLRFLLEEYYVEWPVKDQGRSREQVLQRLDGRITDWRSDGDASAPD